MKTDPRRLLAAAAATMLAALCFWSVRLVAQDPSADEGQAARPPATSSAAAADGAPAATVPESLPFVPDPKQVGGEPESIVQVANLVYAGVKSSHCFSDHFLVTADKESAISTSRRFHAVKLSADDLFNFPLVIMTGEGSFQLTAAERENLRQYADEGGFLLASAGCSSPEWDRSFRREMAAIFPATPLQAIGMDHAMFHTVYDISELHAKHGTPQPLEGITLGGRLAIVYSKDGLNDTAHTQGCCCCGGNEITNCVQVNVNVLAYSLIY